MNQQPNWKIPFILSAVLAIGGSFIYWLQYSHKPKQEKVDTLSKKPLGLPSDDTQIAMIKVKTAKGLIELKCLDLATKGCKAEQNNAKWQITHPVELNGDSDNVKDFLHNATSLLATETVDLKEETPDRRKQLMKEYGLDDDTRTAMNTQFVELVTSDGKRYTAWFGTEHPIGDKFFVARSVDGTVNDQTIFLISNYFKNNLAKDLTYFRDKTLFTFARGDVESFEARTSDGKLSGKKVNGLWEINGLPGEHDRIETALASIAKTQAKEFPRPDEYKGAKSIVKYDLKTKDKSFTIEVLSKELDKDHKDQRGHPAEGAKKYFAKVSTRPEVVEIDSVLVTQIDKKLNEFRKQTIFTDAEKVTTTLANVSFRASPKPFHFELKNGTWTTNDTSNNVDLKKVQSLLDALTATRVVNFLTAVPGGSVGEMTVQLGDDKNPSKFHYRFTATKDKVFATDLNSKRKEAFEMNEAMKSALPFTEESWKMAK
ncbi:MAG: DUF4340 domain-containing protein [Bdellovibrionales bacterium]|nr:DUF4340 domain-containing protein [Bdellovibrionales bacterium]